MRAVLAERARQRLAALPMGDADRERCAALARAVEAGKPVTVPLETLLAALWHSGLIDARGMHEQRNAAAAAGTASFVVAPDGSYAPA